MVDFRKAILLLAMMVAVTGIASAQIAPLVCTANAGQPPILRGEGVAEPVGQVMIICTGGQSNTYGTTIPTINVQIFMSAPVTSRLLVKDQNYSEAILLIDEPSPTASGDYKGQVACEALASCPVTALGGGVYWGGYGFNRPNVFQAQQVGSNSLAWLGVPFDPPGTTPNRVLRIANVRVNANYAGVSPGLIPTAVNMFISISGTGSLTLVNPQLTVGYVQYGLGFSAETLTINQCEKGDRTLSMKLKEMFGTAFLRLGSTAQDQPGVIYNTENAFWKGGASWPTYPTGATGTKLTADAGAATQATRFILRYSNVPANVTLKVPTSATSPDASVQVSLCSGCDGSTTASDGAITLTGGAGASVYTVLWADPAVISNIEDVNMLKIAMTITTKSSPLPGLGTATVTANYAPTTTVFAASVTAPVPRFVDNPQSATTFTISPCQTNLLFPFVTNKGGFDTGIAISNTSADPFGTVTQSGPCTINYYGDPVVPAQTSGTINPGTTAVFTLSGGGTHGIVASPGFQGYIIAQCNFQYGHGFAFISDLGATRLAEGYLALVMDQDMYSGGTTRTKAKSETLKQ